MQLFNKLGKLFFMSSARDVRLRREKRILLNWPFASDVIEISDDIIRLAITGPTDTPFHGLKYTLRISFPHNYPFYPPNINFESPFPYHPNISMDKGLICLDVLKMSPVGTWKANIGIHSAMILGIEAVIEAVTRLLAEPNVDDPLSLDIAKEFLVDYASFCHNVRNNYTKSETLNFTH